MWFFLMDVECFQHEEIIIIKELCFMDCMKCPEHSKPLHKIFKAPRPWSSLTEEEKHAYSYQIERVHHLKWDEGSVSYSQDEVVDQIFNMLPCLLHWPYVIYVFGNEKTALLKKKFPMFNINVFPFCHDINELTDVVVDKCSYRNHGYKNCAMIKCYRMYALIWYSFR